jgi:hypothetical protein
MQALARETNLSETTFVFGRDPETEWERGGGMFRTTTLITKNRIFVPVPEGLQEEFKVATGPKEFFVRFDVLSSPSVEDAANKPSGE